MTCSAYYCMTQLWIHGMYVCPYVSMYKCMYVWTYVCILPRWTTMNSETLRSLNVHFRRVRPTKPNVVPPWQHQARHKCAHHSGHHRIWMDICCRTHPTVLTSHHQIFPSLVRMTKHCRTAGRRVPEAAVGAQS